MENEDLIDTQIIEGEIERFQRKLDKKQEHENFGKYLQDTAPSGNCSLVKSLNAPDDLIVLNDEAVNVTHRSEALQEVQALEESQRKKRLQYEKDRAFFERQILQKTRSVGEINEDYIKILHPRYREKFLAGIEKYGTVGAAIKYMKDVHGLNVRYDILKRMSVMIPALQAEIDNAIEAYRATLHMAMYKRAVEGVERGVYHQGEQVGTEKVYSDALLAKMVDTYNPEYKEAKVKDTQKGNTINVQIIKDFHNYKRDA